MAKELVFKLKVIDESGNTVEKAVNNIKDLKKAQADLSAQLEKTPIGSAKWKELKANLAEVEKAQQQATIAQKGFIGTLKDIPGPLGALGQGLGGLNTAFKALIANPIGAVIAALGIVFTAVSKALNSTEEGMFKLNKIFGAFTGIIDPIVKGLGEFASLLADKIITGIEGLITFAQKLGILGENFGQAAKDGMALADSLNKIDEEEGDLAVSRAQQNKLLAEAREILTDTNATFAQRKKALDDIKKSEESLAARELALAQKRLAAARETIRLKGASKEALDAEEQALISLANAEEQLAGKKRLFNREEKKLAAEEKAQAAERKKNAEDRAKKEQEILEKIRDLRNENYLNSIADEKFREEETARLAKEKAERELKNLQLTEKQKGELKAQIAEQYRLKILAIDKKYDDKETEKEKKKAEDLKNLLSQIRDAEAEQADEQRALQIKKTEEYYDNLIAQAEKAGLDITELEDSKFGKLTELYNKFQAEDLTKKQTKEAQETANLRSEIEARIALQMTYINAIGEFGSIISALAGENKKAQIAGLVIERAAAIAKVVKSVQVANIGALATPQAIASGGISAIPIITANKIAGGISIAAIIAEAAKSISEINSAEVPQPINTPAPAGSKFQTGGLLMGPGHSRGGIKTMFGELEGGEFIVNRLATQQFLPMLESMNQVGQTSSEKMSSASAPAPIIKTYVVANEMATELERKKKLDELARL